MYAGSPFATVQNWTDDGPNKEIKEICGLMAIGGC
jgi:hypothetical protein